MKSKETKFAVAVLILNFCAFFWVVFPSSVLAYGDIIYVDVDAPGIHDGTSWDTAYTYLQDGIDSASFGDEIWVAAGTYIPTINQGGFGNRYKAFQMKYGVAIYGGFDPSVGDTEFEDRNWRINETVLSGNIGLPKSTSDNSFHVFYHHNELYLDSTAVLDGFTISDGNANGSTGHTHEGGGMYNDENSPSVVNCTFRDNYASLSGGGMFNKNWASPVIIDTLFTNNASSNGGGMKNFHFSSPSLTGCTFDRNYAENLGPGMSVSSAFSSGTADTAPTLTNCIFKNNKGTGEFSDGGGLHVGLDSSPVLSNCLFYYNYSYYGGGIITTMGSAPIVTNCTFYANWSHEPGGAIHNDGASPEITNSIIWENSPGQIHDAGSSSSVVTYCDVSGGYPGAGNKKSDPRFRSIPDFWTVTTEAGTTTTVEVTDAALFHNGDYIEIDDDGIRRTVSSTRRTTVTFSPALDDPSEANTMVTNWGTGLFVPVKENFHLQASSPCIEAGTNSASGLPALDFDDDARVIDSDNDGTATVDMGIDEIKFEIEGIIFVDKDAVGSNNGSSWGDAFNNLQDALSVASSGDEIWVAAGTYRPTLRSDPGDPRSAAFRMKNGVAIYGGFDPSVGDTTFEDRDWQNNETVLSGDIQRVGVHDDNSYHVFYHAVAMVPLNTSAILDGFTIRDGRAGSSHGGGMFNDGASPTVTNCLFSDNRSRDGGGIYNINSANPTLTDCTFLDNSCPLGDGGGMYNNDSSPSLTRCTFGDTFQKNTAGGLGGGVYNLNASPSFTECTFATNDASSGGGMYNDSSSPSLTDCTFDRNKVFGITEYCRGGGMYCENSSPTLTGCVFIWNLALSMANARGGAIFCDATSAPIISGCTFENNRSQLDGAAIYCDGASPSIVDGTVIVDNEAENGDGGGIYCSPSSAPTITDSTIENNMAKRGGGVFCLEASPTISQCTITGNEGVIYGGGICLFQSSPDITGSTISNNFTTTRGFQGGGIYCCFYSSPTVEETDIIDNTSDFGGGVAITEMSSPTFTNCNISGNYADFGAGGVDCISSSPTFTNCVVSNNTAAGEGGDGWGGGMRISDGDPALTNCSIWGNETEGSGGALMIHNTDSESPPILVNCTLWDNEATGHGGGIYALFASAVLTNCTLWGNDAGTDGGGEGGGIYTFNSTMSSLLIVTNSILWNNTAADFDQIKADSITVNNSNIQGGYAGTDNINANPMLVDPANGDFHLQSGSPCIDAGSNSAPSLPDYDFEGDNRILDGDGNGSVIADMGADEAPELPTEVWINDDYIQGGENDGHMWGFDAFAAIQDGIDAVGPWGTVYVGPGYYTENIELKDGVVIEGAGADVTTIDGGEIGSVITAWNLAVRPFVSGLTITNGTSIFGGGILSNGSLELFDCILTGNSADWGGAMYNSNSSANITSCIFLKNTANNGGAICNINASPDIINCIFSTNKAIYGGGVFNYNNSSPDIINCTFLSNPATGNGGGIYNLSNSSPIVTNCILWDNSPEEIYTYHDGTSVPVVTYSDVEGGYFGRGNLNENPDLNIGTLRLRGSSPCIDAGNNDALPLNIKTDFEGDIRVIDGDDILGAIVDMGADEYLPGGPLFKGDYNGDEDVDGSDLATLTEGYGTLYDGDDLRDFAGDFGQGDYFEKGL